MGTAGVPISGYRPFPPIACRMFMPPISSQTALWTMRSMIASACTPLPSLGCQSFFLNCARRTVDAPPVAQLEKPRQHPPEQLARTLEQPLVDCEEAERPVLPQ